MSNSTRRTSLNYPALIEESNAKGFNVLDEYKDLSKEELDRITAGSRLPFSVMLLNVTGDLNCGCILRSAYLLGATRAFIVGRRKIDNRSLVGLQNYLEIIRHDCLMDDGLTLNYDAIIKIVIDNHLYAVACEVGGRDVRTFDWQSFLKDQLVSEREICLVFGNEGIGIPDDFLRNFETILSVPQVGVLRSMNVSSAASIIIWELSRALKLFSL